MIARVHRVKPHFQKNRFCYLVHDNAPEHSLGLISEFLAKSGITALFHPPYSPDLALAAFLFPKLNIAMKVTRFEAVSSIQQTVTRELRR
jgi:transposase